MTTIKFKDLQVHDDRRMIHREESIQRVLAFSGVHETDFADFVSEAFTAETSTLTDFDIIDSEGTWQVSAGKLHGQGGGAVEWYKCMFDLEPEPGFTVTFDKYNSRGAFLFKMNDSWQGYMVYWDGVNVSIRHGTTGQFESALMTFPCTYDDDSTITIGVYPRRYDYIDIIDDITIAVWFDNRLICATTVEDIDYRGNHIGFAVFEDDFITLDNLRIPELHNIIDWTSVDPGEEASASLSRTIGRSRIRLQARYDGTVKAWKNTSLVPDWYIPAGRSTQETLGMQIYPPNHMRTLGAVHEVNTWRDGHQGHIFAIGQDPNALSETATYNQGSRQHLDAEEAGMIRRIGMAPNPVLEVEDVVVHEADTWRVSGISYSIRKAGSDTYVLNSDIEIREAL
jgi:hypothetical protein